jgi:hypothetical protein
MKCFISRSSSELWKWHRRLDHLSFDLLCRFSGVGLLRGLPLLKFESNFVLLVIMARSSLHPILR